MEDNTQQTQEIRQTQEIPQPKEVSLTKSNKGPVAIIILLTLIFVVLGAILAYQIIKAKVNPNQNGQKTSQEITQETGLKDSTNTEEQKQDTTAGDETKATDTTVQKNTPDIDKDLETLDELDLSGIENDYAEDQLGDF